MAKKSLALVFLYPLYILNCKKSFKKSFKKDNIAGILPLTPVCAKCAKRKTIVNIVVSFKTITV